MLASLSDVAVLVEWQTDPPIRMGPWPQPLPPPSPKRPSNRSTPTAVAPATTAAEPTRRFSVAPMMDGTNISITH